MRRMLNLHDWPNTLALYLIGHTLGVVNKGFVIILESPNMVGYPYESWGIAGLLLRLRFGRSRRKLRHHA